MQGIMLDTCPYVKHMDFHFPVCNCHAPDDVNVFVNQSACHISLTSMKHLFSKQGTVNHNEKCGKKRMKKNWSTCLMESCRKVLARF
jgi:hypothetical protein